MKKSRIIAPAAAILVFSSAAAVTGTVAWFTASNLVDVNGLYMKAEAENGIVISNEAKAEWKINATASHNANGEEFAPISTSDLDTWYHGSSESAQNGQLNVAYQQLTVGDTLAEDGTAEDGIWIFKEGNEVRNAFLVNSFYIQSATVSAIGDSTSKRDIYITDVKVTGNTGTDNSALLDQSLRLVIKTTVTNPATSTNEDVITFISPLEEDSDPNLTYNILDGAPTYNAESEYSVNDFVKYGGNVYKCKTAIDTPEEWTASKWDEVTDRAVTSHSIDKVDADHQLVVSGTNGLIIPGYEELGTNALQFDVYLYFEGEDTHHKSENLRETLDQLAITFSFGNKLHSA